MTNKNKRSRSRSRNLAPRPSARAPRTQESEPSPRRGFLDSLLAPKGSGSSSMPTIRRSLARGVAVVASPPVAVAAVVLVVLEWLVALALGYEGPFARFVSCLAMPPVGTMFDASLSGALFGAQGALFGLLGAAAVRAVIQAFLVALVVETLRSSIHGRWTLVRALRTLPAAFAVAMAGVSLFILANILGSLLGFSFAFLVQVAALVAGVYLLGFAPVIAADEGRALGDTLGRSVRAARMPGAGNLSLAAIYVIASFVVSFVPGPGSELGVNPAVGAWVLVLVANLLHVVMQATIAFRYLSVADEVPAAAARQQPAPRARGRR